MVRAVVSKVVLVLLCSFACFSSLASDQRKSTDSAPDADEYAIYNLFASMSSVNKRVTKLVIQDLAEMPIEATQPFDSDRQFESYVQRVLPGIQDETVADFRAKGKEPVKLENLLCAKVPCILLSRDEMHAIFSVSGDGWNSFYKKYPGAQGILSFSRIGFNKRRNQALVCVGNQASYKMGAGHLVFLAKKDGAWVIVKEVTLWIS